MINSLFLSSCICFDSSNCCFFISQSGSSSERLDDSANQQGFISICKPNEIVSKKSFKLLIILHTMPICLSTLYCCRPEHLIFHRHLLRSNNSLDLANLLQVGFDLRNTLERKILSPKIKASGRQQYTIRKNKVSMSHHISPSHVLAKDCLFPRLHSIKNSLQQILKKYPLPDMDFIVSIHDALLSSYDVPIFVMAKIERFDNQILIPDFEALRGRYQVLPSQDITQDDEIPLWDKKKQQLLWRGGPGQHPLEGFATSLQPNDPHCLSRIKLCHLSAQNPEIIDAKFSYLGSGFESLSDFFGSFISFEAQLLYKYQMLIDGYSCAYTTSGWKFFSDSLVFKEDSNHIQWYYNELKPFEHYIPVKEGLDDLVEKLKWAMTHDGEVKKIAHQARDFALSHITQEKNRLYFYYTLLAYSKLNRTE